MSHLNNHILSFQFDMCSYEELDSLQNILLKLYREELHEIIAHYEVISDIISVTLWRN